MTGFYDLISHEHLPVGHTHEDIGARLKHMLDVLTWPNS